MREDWTKVVADAMARGLIGRVVVQGPIDSEQDKREVREAIEFLASAHKEYQRRLNVVYQRRWRRKNKDKHAAYMRERRKVARANAT
jgi:polyphosphate kinase